MEISSVQSQIITSAVTPMTTPEKTAEQRELVSAVKALNAAELFGSNRELSFMFDRETRRPVIRIVDRNTKEVITQIPAEYVLRMAQQARA